MRRLSLRGFRNYEKAEISLSPTWNSFYGHNAQGKTNLLEALFLLATGRSFRTRHLHDLLREGAEAFFLELDFERDGIRQQLRVWCDGRQRRIWHNQTLVTSLRDLLGRIPTVFLGPDDVALVKGGPALRRHFLDLQIAQTDPLYVTHLARYQKALKQRNVLLRQRQESTLEIWEEELAQSGAYLTQQRQILLADLAQPLQNGYLSLGHGEGELGVRYHCFLKNDLSDVDMYQALREALARHRGRDLHLGNTQIGPHRDDFNLTLGAREVRVFASEGQQRSVVAALRLAEWQRLRDRVGLLPVFLVDDVGVSLDGGRRERLVNLLSSCGQVCVTAPDPLVPSKFEGASFEIDSGQVLKGGLACGIG